MTTTNKAGDVWQNRLKLILLWMVPFGLMILASVVFNLVQSGQISVGSKNQGYLIQPPAQLGEYALTSNKDVDNIWLGKWSMVIRGGAECDQRCLDTLLITRQIHIRLNKEANRTQRVYLSDAATLDKPLAEHLAAEHHYLTVAKGDSPTLALLDQAVVAAAEGHQAIPRFFLVDPQGWAMMVYSDQHDGAAVLKDLKYLLKYSAER